MRILKNSFYLYVILYIVVVVIYSFGWSNILPELSIELFLFFTCTFLLALFLGYILSQLRGLKYEKALSSKYDYIPILIIVFSNGLEFLYSGYIPLIKYLNLEEFVFKHYGGIPTFHVVLVSFTTFYSAIAFHKLVSSFNISRTIYYIITLIPAVLTFNRGMFFTMFFTSLLIFLYSFKNRINFKLAIALSVGFLYIFYLFGKTSNYRANQTESNVVILKVSEASENFRNSSIPHEYMWSYMYVCSPMGNLQNMINIKSPEYDFGGFLLTNICPDFIQRRIKSLFNVKTKKAPLITDYFTVSTFYGKAYSDFGFIGMTIMFGLQAGMVFFTLLVLKPSSKYIIPSLAILNTIIILNVFSNAITFSGISFQVIWILVFGTIEKYKFVVK